MSQNNGYRNRLVSGRGFDTEREYVHQEYPKWVNGVVVNDEAEEAVQTTAAIEAEAAKPAKAKNDLE